MSKANKKGKGGKGKDDEDFEALMKSLEAANLADAKVANAAAAAAGKDASAAGKAAKPVGPLGPPLPKEVKDAEEEKIEFPIRGIRYARPDDSKEEPPKTKDGRRQTAPPTIPVSELFPSAAYPSGEIMPYAGASNTARTTSAEARAMDRMQEDMYNEVREAAEVHRQARQSIQRFIKPGRSLIEIAERIEAATHTLVRKDGLNRGWAFPTGLSRNHVAAHFSPNAGDTSVVQQGDVMKVDFGVQIAGHIVDCAFTVHWDPEYDELVNAVKEATEAGIAAAGIDMRLGDVGGIINEVMSAHECTIKGKTYKVKPIIGLNGHNIAPYKIHGGKSVPLYNNHDQTKMEEGEFFAIETFGSTGKGQVNEDHSETSHYMKAWDVSSPPTIRSGRAKDLMKTIDKNFGTLAFCRRWLDQLGESNYMLAMKQLCDVEAIRPYPALVDTKGSFTAQFEHTILLRPTCKEVISRGFDY